MYYYLSYCLFVAIVVLDSVDLFDIELNTLASRIGGNIIYNVKMGYSSLKTRVSCNCNYLDIMRL